MLVTLPMAPALAVAQPPVAELRPFYGQSLAWKPCSFDAEVECASVEVPLDYSHPEGERIRVAISRQKATDRDKRRGALFWNPGGPGGSGLKTHDGQSAPKKQFENSGLNTVYDLIGFDPRGIGESTPLRCEEVDLPPVVSRPTDADFDVFATWGKESEEACDKVDGQKRRFFNTVYGSMFAPHLDRSILDSSVDPDRTGRPYMISKSKAERRNVEVWASWAAEHDKIFGLGTSRSKVMETVEAVSDQLAQAPVGSWDQTMFDLFMRDSQHWST